MTVFFLCHALISEYARRHWQIGICPVFGIKLALGLIASEEREEILCRTHWPVMRLVPLSSVRLRTSYRAHISRRMGSSSKTGGAPNAVHS